jgi:predicted MFS family arabinose efflux permease
VREEDEGIHENTIPLSILYGVAGVGVAAFTPSALFLGGVVAQAAGYRAAFIASAGLVTVTFALGVVWIERSPARVRSADTKASFADVRMNPIVWAGWIISFCGLVTQAVVYTFFPLLADQRGLTAADIGVVFLVLGLANTAARIPAGWLVDRTEHSSLYAIGGVLIGSIVTAVLPHAGGQAGLLTLVAVFGAVNGTAGVAIGVALTRSTTPAMRGLVMGGYSTALYLGLALGSLALGPVIARHGYGTGFWVGGLTGAVGALVAAVLWMRTRAPARSPREMR